MKIEQLFGGHFFDQLEVGSAIRKRSVNLLVGNGGFVFEESNAAFIDKEGATNGLQQGALARAVGSYDGIR